MHKKVFRMQTEVCVINRLITISVVLFTLLSTLGCMKAPANTETSGASESSVPSQATAAQEPPSSEVPQSSEDNIEQALETRYFTDIMPPLTPEEEKMVNLPVADDILFEFESYKCFSHPPLENGLTYGELWRYVGSPGSVHVPYGNVPYKLLPNGERIEVYPTILPHLKSVTKLTTTELEHIWEDVAQMTWLTYLAADDLDLYPQTLNNLVNLELLFFRSSEEHSVAELPDIFDRFKSLKQLAVSRGSVSILPDSIFRIETLEGLDLGENKITHIPKEIGQLKNLKHLYLNDNPIRHIPDEICELSNLESLRLGFYTDGYKEYRRADLSYALADSIPENIGTLSNLKKLSFYNLPITQLPESLFNLTELERVDIDLPLKTIPENLNNWANLENIWFLAIHVLNDDLETNENGPLQAEIDRILPRNNKNMGAVK